MKKVKLLFYGDSPTCASGFGTVSRNILEQLWKTNKYDIQSIGINYHGGWHSSGLVERYKIDRAGNNPQNDPFGTYKLINALVNGNFDIIFMIANIDRPVILQFAKAFKELKDAGKKTPKWVHYFPIDCEVHPAWEFIFTQIDCPVCYCKFAYKKILDIFPWLEKKLIIIPHGVNLDDYFPLKTDKKNEKIKVMGEDYAHKLLITNINRFIQRKDVSRSLLVFREFKKVYPEVIFYPHCSFNKEEMGCLADHVRAVGLNVEDLIYNDPKYFNHNQGYPIKGMRRIYHASDVIISTTLGEGWGFSCTEAMACKIPVLFPRNTSLVELIGENEERGWLADSGKDIDNWIVMPEDNGMWRPLTSVRSMVDKLVYMQEHPEEVNQKVEVAYDWVQKLSWDIVCNDWIKLMEGIL